MSNFRIEKDSMGEMQVPEDALYGASTQRAVLNFPISNIPMPILFIHSLGYLKSACAYANENLGKLSNEKSVMIQKISQEIYEDKLTKHFVVDIFQTGSGTSSNMNTNEVIANRSDQILGGIIGKHQLLHPNDDVNMSQSSNDTIPTTLHISLALAIQQNLIPSLEKLTKELEKKEKSFADIIKIGRTHLMDATPLSLGQVFSGYRRQAEKSLIRAKKAFESILELAIGGTAVGTGINCPKEFSGFVVKKLNQLTGIDFREAENHFEAQAARDDAVEVAGYLSTIAASMTKIANDIRLLGSGPRCGIGELDLPSIQPGSSIMPGKVNPVMSEMLVQVAIYVQGLCQSVVIAGRDGHFELNVTIPMIAHSLHQAISYLANGIDTFIDKCLSGLKANEQRCQELLEKSLMLVTALNEHIGYDNCSRVAKKAFQENKTLKQVLLDEELLDEATIDQALDPKKMI